MDIRNFFGTINKTTGKPEKRKIESKSSEDESPVVKRKPAKLESPDENKKSNRRKSDEKKPKKSSNKPASDSDDFEEPIKKGKHAEKTKEPKSKKSSAKPKPVVIDSDDEQPIKRSKKATKLLGSDDEDSNKRSRKSSIIIDSDDDSVVVTKTKPVDSAAFFNSKPVKKSNDIKETPLKVTSPAKSPAKSTSSKSPSKKATQLESESKTSKKSPIKSNAKSSSNGSPKPSKPWVHVPRESIPKLPKSEMWVDKYKPDAISKVIGQGGDRSSAKKLVKWLTNWFRNKDTKPAFGKFGAGNDDGAGYKAALLSGPPGIGKTTTAHLAAKECGFDFVEFNASDTRNKKSMEEHVRTLLTNRTISSSFGKAGGKSTTAKHLLVMDEVDGMGGNSDRGGIAELIQLIKNTKVPIICICNDRNNPKIRSLANYCFDLRFMRPRAEQIKSAMMSVCFKENVKIDPQVLSQLIESSDHDIRQVLHYLSLHTSKEQKMDKMSSNEQIKDVKLGPFDACKKMFTAGPEYEAMSYHDKAELFFADYSLMPLFAYDNYIRSNPIKAKNETEKLRAAAQSISAISFGDTIESEIRSKQNWSLLPMQAAFATVMPGFYMNGYFTGQIGFPALLGKISNMNKRERLLAELKQHMNLKISGSKVALNLDYLRPLRDHILSPLLSKDKDAIEKTIQALQEYCLRKDDIESIIELTLWGSEKNPFTQVDSKTKAALTRSYNKNGEYLPYVTDDMYKKAKVKGAKAEKKSKKTASNSSDEEDEADVNYDDEDVIPDY